MSYRIFVRALGFSMALIVLLILWMALLVALPVTVASAESPTRVVKLEFINHLQGAMPEQDVFIEHAGESGIYRVAPDEEPSEAMLAQFAYTSMEPQAHDPFALGEQPLGPYEKGQPLGFTLGEWLAAKGSGVYTVNGGRAVLDLAFENLVPNGVYTVWCAYLTVPPNFGIVDKPCGAQDGSENTVVADADGNMAYYLELDRLRESTDETITLVAIAYHSDGKTYGAYPGDFGQNSHVQLLSMLPQPEPEVLPETGGDNSGSTTFVVIAIAAGIIAIAAKRFINHQTHTRGGTYHE